MESTTVRLLVFRLEFHHPGPRPTRMNPIDLRQTVCALAEALSLVGIDETQHGERVAVMAHACAQRLGWDQEWQDDLIHSALLHDCGVSSSRVHSRLVNELDWAGSATHCNLGHQRLGAFPPLAHLAPIVLYHHTHWDRLAEQDAPQRTRLLSNMVYLTDRADAISAQLHYQPPVKRAESVRARLLPLRGSFFQPELLDAFLDAAANTAFWADLAPEPLTRRVRDLPYGTPQRIAGQRDLRRLAKIFAGIVDAKSRFTYEHSLGVARLAVHLAERLQLPAATLLQIEIAALLHDLGKLGVPDQILDKPGRLAKPEWEIMRRHSLRSFQVLRQIDGFEKIAEWAGDHHETLMGDGYPFHLREQELGTEARVIIVADIFQALAQDRPYRAALPPQQILSILRDKARQHLIDAGLVDLVGQDLDRCWRLARCQE